MWYCSSPSEFLFVADFGCFSSLLFLESIDLSDGTPEIKPPQPHTHLRERNTSPIAITIFLLLPFLSFHMQFEFVSIALFSSCFFFCLSRCTFHFFWIIIVLIQTVRMGTMQEMRKKECSERSMWRERIGSTANNQAQCSIRKKESTT